MAGTEGQGVRYRSKKMERVYRERRKLVAELLEERPWCEMRVHPAICTRRATEVHEVLSRGRGGSILDRENCMVGCHSCHAWVTTHPKEAEERGLLRKSGEADGNHHAEDSGAPRFAGE